MKRSEIDHIERLYGEGKISRAALLGACRANEIDDPEYQKGDNLGFPAPDYYGAGDAGHIDARANKRMFPKESTPGQQPLPGNAAPSVARVRRNSAVEYWPDNPYGGPSRRQ